MSINPPVFENPARDSFETSLWHQTAIVAPRYPTLRGAHKAGVVIVGSGYTGLSAAIDLAGQGSDVVVLDAREPGFGASGRNGGQVIPAFKYDPDGIAKVYGDELGETVLDMVSKTADVVFDLVRRFDIACDLRQTGWIQAAHGESGCDTIRSRQRQWQSRGAPVELLETDALKRLAGTGLYPLGLLFRNGGTVQPLSYARGMAIAAASLGARVFSDSQVRSIKRDASGWKVATKDGSVLANKVVIATNGYNTPIWPGLRQSVVPLYSMQIASKPLPEELRRQVLPVVESMADTRRLVWYFRKDRDHRFIIGSRGPFKALPSERDVQSLVEAACTLFPMLRGTQFPYRWAGRVAMTTDQIPHLHQLAPGVFSALGCNGRGVGMGTMMGKILAAACLGADSRSLPYPVSDLHPIPFHAFHRVGVHAMITYYRMLDQFS
ncbi:FAD-binding oxidoreductase [Mesorhizobium sp. SP-1A]|uniref:NAD(P)/FAD-dependent oxidoreductase n=1 Tax=Mesorhizobium sp. SP-1A TaxID=3077840 RepID=UPI0028F6F0FF|nr:FAD-binding oxidoreductase [Mesorhizobium sp. SP-1A]